MTPTLVFDIETVPDVVGLRRLHRLPATLSDAAVLTWASQQRRAASGSDFLPLYLQRVVAIACALREGNAFRVWSLGESADPEPELIRRFFDGVDRYTPQLVSWNGGGFDLPVLSQRALIHGVVAEKFWDWGDEDREFKFNNYLGRYHTRHLDLMDVLAMYQPRAAAGLDAMARLSGFPGKMGMDGSEVGAAYREGRIDHPPLLRDRRDEYLSAVSQVPATARGAGGWGVRGRSIVGAGKDRLVPGAALAGVPCRVGRQRLNAQAGMNRA